jgi:bifunctional non-homologous end joining protein LigD
MSRTSSLPKRLQPMLATLTDAPFDDPGWVFEDKYDGFRMIAQIRRGKVALYSRNGKIVTAISRSPKHWRASRATP